MARRRDVSAIVAASGEVPPWLSTVSAFRSWWTTSRGGPRAFHPDLWERMLMWHRVRFLRDNPRVKVPAGWPSRDTPLLESERARSRFRGDTSA